MNSKKLKNLDKSGLPKHIAIIMDGNGRWAKKRLLNRLKGHEKGVETVRTITRTCSKIGISVLTLYAFSTENWQRPKTEVAALMAILKRFLKAELPEMMENNIRLNTIGQTWRLPEKVKKTLEQTMAATSKNKKMQLNLALSYGGRNEILHSVKQIARDVKNGLIDPDNITEDYIGSQLYTKNMPDPDLLIRTSGEMRVSNFFLWQIAYSEIYFTKTLWPDFTKDEFLDILNNYQGRERRFGKTGDQVKK
ncbi:ditrans,polycis-undecaprenyl-diphosphate synthase ((2E,6E)-farnesyl-diphosphate specific) [Candidatus Magnetomoraceae bacterium gMMP-15]